MKKALCILLALASVFVLAMAMASCGSKSGNDDKDEKDEKEEKTVLSSTSIVGEWYGRWFDYDRIITFNKDGTWLESGGTPGTYETEGSTLIITEEDDEETVREFKYSVIGNTLTLTNDTDGEMVFTRVVDN